MNIKKIIVGTRSVDGIVNEISTLNVKDIAKQCQVSTIKTYFWNLNSKIHKNVSLKIDVFPFLFPELLVAVSLHGVLLSIFEISRKRNE